MNETERKIIHILISVILIEILFTFGRMSTIALLFLGLLLGSIIINLKLLGYKLPILDIFIDKFERKGVRFPGLGSAWFVVGVLLTVTFLENVDQIASIIFILGFGDGLATIAGQKGKIKLSYNSNKTLEGTAAFFLVSLIAYRLIGPMIIPLAFICAVLESMKIPIDDNVMIPLVGIIFFSMI